MLENTGISGIQFSHGHLETRGLALKKKRNPMCRDRTLITNDHIISYYVILLRKQISNRGYTVRPS